MWARIEDNIVQEIITFDPTGKFHTSIVFIACGTDVKAGYTYNGSDFSAPIIAPLTPIQIRNAALAYITYTRPSDGAEIQIRHPDYASDYIIMTSAINMLAPLETRLWIVKDNLPTTVTREDLEAAIAFGSAEVDRIFVEYITALQGG
jgi:hypothetical protein